MVYRKTFYSREGYSVSSFNNKDQKINSAYDIELESFSKWWFADKNRFKSSNFSFRVDNQGKLFFSTLTEKGFDTAFLQLRMDLYGYYLEYIKQEALLPFSLRFNQNEKLVGDFYGDKPITEIVDPKERDGVVVDAMRDLEEKIKNLGDNQLIFRISPSGWTGLGYNYTESQSQIYWREGDKIRGLTIRLNADLEKIINFFEKFSSYFLNEIRSKVDEKEKIKAITKLNLVFNCNPVDFLNFLSEYFKTDHRGRNLLDSISNWRQSEFDFHHYDELTNLINWLEYRLRKKGLQSKEELEMILSFVLMAMAGQEFRKTKSYSASNYNDYSLLSESLCLDPRYLPSFFYNQVFDYLSSLPGCAGGGIFKRNQLNVFSISSRSNDFLLDPFGVREIDNVSYSEKLRCVTCPFCKQVVDAEIVHEESGDYIQCPSCKAKVKKN